MESIRILASLCSSQLSTMAARRSFLQNIVFICFFTTAYCNGDPSCSSECNPDKYPLCGTWLINETNAQAAGSYQLNKGMVKMGCTFSSLPVPATVVWQRKATHSTSWKEFACSNKQDNKSCRENKEYVVESSCTLKTTELTMSGAYRCHASTPQPGPAQKTFGSEFDINVVGVGKTQVTSYSLPYGQLGHIEVEVCANPKPEIFWLTADAIIRSNEGNSRISSTHLHHKKIREQEDGPAATVPYCYIAKLLVRNVTASDTFSLLVRADTTEEKLNLPVEVTGVPVFTGSSTSLGLGTLLTALAARQFLL